MIDAHVHIAPGGGGSGLLPAEALRLAALRGFRAVGLIVRSDGGFDVSLRLLSERVQGLSLFVNVEAFVGVELVHVPPALLPDAVTEARQAGAELVLVHGESLADAVAEGTNLAAVEAGKHVFVEKPVTLCIEDLEKLIAAEKAHPGQACMVGYMRRYSQGFLKCKELLAADDRKIEYMRFRDIILEGDFFMGQTRLPFLCSDIPDSAKVDGSARRKEQLIRALGPDSTASPT